MMSDLKKFFRSNKHRLFWLITCALCWFGCAVMVQDSLNGFYHRPLAFTLESTYLDWEIDFPSVSVCLRFHPSSIDKAGAWYAKKYGKPIRNQRAFKWLLSSFDEKGTDKTSAQFAQLTSEDVRDIYNESIVECNVLLAECIWLSMFKFNCCDEFLPVRTAAGVCYMFNSMHTRADWSTKKYAMNRRTGVGYLGIGITRNAFFGDTGETLTVYIDNSLALRTPVSNKDKEIHTFNGLINTVYFTMDDRFNEPGLRYIHPSRRGCRFPDETENFHTYKWYSSSGCFIEMQMEAMREKCGCINHLYPYATETPVCNYTSRVCSIEAGNEITPEEYASRCLPDCEGTVMRIYQSSSGRKMDPSIIGITQGIHLELLALPASRYKRYVVRSLLDLVVAVGSTAGLFMGAGILSLVEIPYWLLLRHGS